MEDFLTEKTSSLSPIGFVCRALDKIVEVSKGMFPGIYALDQCEFVFRIQNVCNDIPGGGGGGAFARYFRSHPRYNVFAIQNQKNANARGLAQGG